MMSLRSSTTDKALNRIDGKTKKQKKVAKVMREFKAGELNSGSKDGPIVKSRKQAIAIALSEAGVKRKDAKEATIAKALAHTDAFALKRKYDAVVNLTSWDSIDIRFADPISDSLRKDFGDLLKTMGSYNPWIEQPANSESPINIVSINVPKLYDCEEAAETISAELERQGLKVLRRDDRAMPRSTVVTFAKLDSLDNREDAKKTLRKIGGKRPGKKCKGSYISADKKCSSDYGLTPSGKRKLTDMGKKSAVELANKVRQQRGLTAVTREGSGQPLPFDRKSRQSASIAKATMSAKDRREKLRREFDPNSSGKRAEMIAKKEEKRAIVGLGSTQKAMAEADAVPPDKPKMTVVKGGLSDENLGSKLLEEIYKTNISSFTGWSPTIKSAKGQGKRSGQRMVKGSMGDATGVPGGLTFKPPGMNKGEQQEFTLLDNLQREYYTKARVKGLDHDTGMMAAYAVGANGSIQEFGAFAKSKNLSPIDEKPKPAQEASQDKALEKMSLGELFKEADRVGSKYQSPNDPIDLTARRQAAEILKEAGVSKAIDRATGKRRLTAIEGGGQSTPKSPLGNLGAKLLTTMNETNQQMAKLVEQKAAIEKKYATKSKGGKASQDKVAAVSRGKRTIRQAAPDMSIAEIDKQEQKMQVSLKRMLGEQQGALEWNRAKLETSLNPDMSIEELGDTPKVRSKRAAVAKTPKPKTTQMAQLQALREAKIKNGTFKRSVDSIDRPFG